MKHLLYLSLIILLTSCSAKKFFQVANATETAWYSGQADGPTGQDFNIFINVKEGVKPVFDSIWIDGRGNLLETKVLSKTLIEIKTTFINRASVSYDLKSSPRVVAPKAYEGRALLRYKIDDEVKYFVVKTFTPTLPVYMP